MEVTLSIINAIDIKGGGFTVAHMSTLAQEAAQCPKGLHSWMSCLVSRIGSQAYLGLTYPGGG